MIEFTDETETVFELKALWCKIGVVSKVYTDGHTATCFGFTPLRLLTSLTRNGRGPLLPKRIIQ